MEGKKIPPHPSIEATSMIESGQRARLGELFRPVKPGCEYL